MKLSKLFTKTSKEISEEEYSINAQYLLRWGFVRKEIAGVYSFLPLWLRVLNKIESIIRRHMDTVSQEILMTALQPIANREKTHRLDVVDVLMKTTGANEKSKQKSTNEYILGCTHEEIVTPLVQEFAKSYKDLPISVYQIQSKFRNEARAKSGLLRGREFRMKDAYSFHIDEADLLKYYEQMKIVYMKIFEDLGIWQDTYITAASWWDFTDWFSHEFQTICEAGEDDIYIDRANNMAYNKEVINPENASKLGVDFDTLELARACEVGNIFPLNTKFSQAFDYHYIDAQSKPQIVYMGCYGIWPSRIMGVLVEKFHDKNGIIRPDAIAPYRYCIIPIGDEAQHIAQELYQKMTEKNMEVVLDDRDCGPGFKLKDADLIGYPWKIIISDKTLAHAPDTAEFVARKTGESSLTNIRQRLGQQGNRRG